MQVKNSILSKDTKVRRIFVPSDRESVIREMQVDKKKQSAANKQAKQKILIVGAGLSGLALANSLAHLGLSFTIIDKAKPDSYVSSTAVCLNSINLEALKRWGVAEVLLAKGHKITAMQMFNGRDDLLKIDLTLANSQFNYALAVNKEYLHKALLENLQRQGIEVQWETALQKIQQTEEACQVRLLNAKKEIEDEFEWVVIGAADEELINNYLPSWRIDDRSSGVWAGAALKVKKDWPFDALKEQIYFSSAGTLLIMPTAKQECEVWYQENAANPPTLTTEAVTEALSERTKREVEFLQNNIAQCSPFAARVFHNHCRSKYVDGHIFLLGEAAHVHSPIGINDVNTHMQDAVNLAWKLQLAIAGAPKWQKWLHSYEIERKKAFNFVIGTTKNISWPASILAGAGTVRQVLASLCMQTTWKAFSCMRGWRDDLVMALSGYQVNYRDTDFHAEHRSNAASFLEGDYYIGDYVRDVAIDEAKQHWFHDMLDGKQWAFCVFPEVGLPYKRLAYKIQKINALLSKVAVPMKVIFFSDRKFKEKLAEVYFDENREIRRHLGVIDQGVFIIRPDGYLAYRSNAWDFESLRGYLEKMMMPL